MTELQTISERALGIRERLRREGVDNAKERLVMGIRAVEETWSGSPLGYHAELYLTGFRKRTAHDFFDVEWGLMSAIGNHTSDSWTKYDHHAVLEAILNKSGLKEADADRFEAACRVARGELELIHEELEALLSVAAETGGTTIKALAKECDEMLPVVSQDDLANSIFPKRTLGSRDQTAVLAGRQIPAHTVYEAWVMLHFMVAIEAENLAKLARRAQLVIHQTATGRNSALQVPTEKKPMITKGASILFLDVSGWSKLNAVAIHKYVELALPKISEMFKNADFKNTWGDAIVATFPSARDAANVALNVRDFFKRATELEGVPQGLSCRIPLHTGEVILIENPLLGRQDIFGSAVHLAARLEPMGAPGHVVCSDVFARALSEVAGTGPKAVSPFQVTLPKDFGEIRAFVVVHNNEAAPNP